MTRVPSISSKETIRVFEKIGYQIARQHGSHVRLYHPTKKPLTIPSHHGDLGRGLLRKLLRDSEISLKEFIDLL